MPKWTYVSDVFASPRDANVVFVAFNNWQRGDYKPYLLQEQRSRHDVHADHGQPAGSARRVGRDPGPRQRQPAVRRHRVRRVRERGRRRALDAAQGRHAAGPGPRHGRAEARERPRAGHVRPRLLDSRRLQRAARDDARVAGRGGRAVTRCATRISSIRHWRGAGAPSSTWATRRIRRSARSFTYSVGRALPADTRLVVDDHDDSGKQVRRMDVSKDAGLRRVVWNLRGDLARRTPPAGEAGERSGRARRGRPGAGAAGAGRRRSAARQPPVRRRRFGGSAARSLEPGRYTRDARQDDGRQVTAIGRPQYVPRAAAAGQELLSRASLTV